MTLPYYPLYLSLLLSVCLFNTPVLSFIIPTNRYHVGIPNSHQIIRISSTQRYLFGGVGGGAAKIPTSPSARDNDAISSIKSAIGKPRNTSCKLIECEFPALQQINKLGDGSLRSSIEAEDANVAFVNKLYNSLERGTVKSSIAIPFIGPDVTVVLSSSASNALINKVQKKIKGATLFSLKEGIPQMADKKGVYVFLTPSSPKDYQAAKTLTEYGCTAVLVNGLFKVCIFFVFCNIVYHIIFITSYAQNFII